MASQIVMPKMSETMEEGVVVKWFEARAITWRLAMPSRNRDRQGCPRGGGDRGWGAAQDSRPGG